MFRDPLLRYYFNRGVRNFGQHVEVELDAAQARIEKAAKGARGGANPGAIKTARLKVLANLLELGDIVKAAYAKPPTAGIKTEFTR